MNSDSLHYVPCLKWKMGEYHAVLKLSDFAKKTITPLIEVPGLEWDFEEKVNKKSIEEVLPSFIKRVCCNWGGGCFIDIQRNLKHFDVMTSGIYPEAFVFDELRKKKYPAVLVIGLEAEKSKFSRGHIAALKAIIAKGGLGVCFRVSIEQIIKPSFKSDLNDVMSALSVQAKDCDFIFDLEAPNFDPIAGFATVIANLISLIPSLNDWRTFVILGSSFPKTMKGIGPGMTSVPRYEWQAYKKLIETLAIKSLRLPIYGDYPIAYPRVPNLDMRKIKSSATIRYTYADNWCIVKGGIYRDDPKQFHALSKALVMSKYFSGATFSKGDESIEKCAGKKTGPGNPTSWREYGTNHHIEYVVRDISRLYASS